MTENAVGRVMSAPSQILLITEDVVSRLRTGLSRVYVVFHQSYRIGPAVISVIQLKRRNVWGPPKRRAAH